MTAKNPVSSTIDEDTNNKPDIGVILPTYCEAENITKLITDIKNLNLNLSILLIDDSSPDNTANLVQQLQNKHKNILIHIRPKKSGLGTAITDGFKILLTQKHPPKYIITMDADYSHNPQDITRLISAAKSTNGIVIGSRYCTGGSVINWSTTRIILSKLANFVASTLITTNIHDYTSGFRCYSTNFIKNTINDLHSKTYEIQVETIRQANLKGFNIKEIPMIFINRKKGKSKLTKHEIKAFLLYTINILLSKNRQLLLFTN